MGLHDLLLGGSVFHKGMSKFVCEMPMSWGLILCGTGTVSSVIPGKTSVLNSIQKTFCSITHNLLPTYISWERGYLKKYSPLCHSAFLNFCSYIDRLFSLQVALFTSKSINEWHFEHNG